MKIVLSMVKILLCDWEGNITSKMDFGENVNYTKNKFLKGMD
jgi:hypothetical protein